MAQKLQCSSRRVDVLTSHRDNKRKEDLLLERDLKEKRNVLKDQIESIQEEINCISQKIWEKKPELSDDVKEEFK